MAKIEVYSRDLRGKEIANNRGQVKKTGENTFKVKSQSGSGFYEVKQTKDGITCTCPDFTYRGGKCKHIAATRYYLEIEKDTPHGITYEKVQLTYAQAWDAYNAAQKTEVKLFDELLKDLVETIPESDQIRGRTRISIHETCFARFKKCIRNCQVEELTAFSKTQLRKDKSATRHTSMLRQNFSTSPR